MEYHNTNSTTTAATIINNYDFSSNFNRNQIIRKYLNNLQQIKLWSIINFHITDTQFDSYLFKEYFHRKNNVNKSNSSVSSSSSKSSSNNISSINTMAVISSQNVRSNNLNITNAQNTIISNRRSNDSSYSNTIPIYATMLSLTKNEICKHILDRKRKILFWLFYIVIAFLFISYKTEISTIVLRNIQTFIYPGMKLWRKMTLPLINKFPGLTQLYDESCLLMNPFFRIDDLNCEPCAGVMNVLDLTNINSAQKANGEFVPFIFKINQDPVHVSDLRILYENDKNVFQRDAYRIKSTNYDVTNLDELFADFNRTYNQIESHNLWRCNRMPPARLLRRLIVKPKRFLPPNGISLERYLTIDTPKAPAYVLPDAECSNMYIQQILGTRIIVLRPTIECRHKCRTLSIRLPQSFVLSYNWWYWRPISIPDQITNSNSISLIGSYC